ncbi:hypothetical protein Hamer_G003650 [Homarus americanus]|uniref:Ig-like domain-containing protein n=1 Tax=Homarus americanus TaxID=6706 RepID=A0A8J5JZC1_HOMAM|nr:hypothetical protein Hamer_G003650 [Homarus americanus]
MTYHGAARYEQVNIPCDLDSYPTPTAFRWTFNNSGESVDISQDHILVAGSRSTVSYTPNTELDYGTLLCWGINSVGQQRHPCIFHVFPAGHPDPVHNCSVYNLSVTVVNVRCVAGFDGGLPQTFILELYQPGVDHLLANASSLVPVFTVGGLPPGMTFRARVYSYNNKGRAETLSLHVYTIKDLAEKRTVKPSPPPEKQQKEELLVQPIVAVVVGVLGGLLLVVGVICALVRLQYGRRSRQCGRAETQDPLSGEEDTKISPTTLKDVAPPSASSGAESWVVGSVTTISSASLPTTYASLPRPSHLSTPANYQQQCGGDDMQYNELRLGGTVPAAAPHDPITHTLLPHNPNIQPLRDPSTHTQSIHPHCPNTQPKTPTHTTQHHDPHIVAHGNLDDNHCHTHYPPPHQQLSAYPHQSTVIPSPTHTVHQSAPPHSGHPQQASWTPSSASIGRRHSLRRDPHPCDTEATVPLMSNQKESSV